MQAEQVLEFLEQHPEFLQEHAASFGLRPSLERVISLSERQLLESRDQNRHLQKQLKTLLANAEGNDSIQRRLQQMTLALLAARTLDELARSVQKVLHDAFELERSALHVWHSAAGGNACYAQPSAECRRQIQLQGEPQCTQYVNDELLAWLPQMPVLQSFALLPLHDVAGGAIGALLIGSSDHQRFAPPLANDYLQNLSAQISASLNRILSLPAVAE